MIPKPPPRENPLGFLYFPPYRVQGVSVAGEATSVQVPELDICFDMGSCPRSSLASKFCAISHGHMDHVGGLAYWCSQRNFQGMGPGTIVCDERIAKDIRGMMTGFINLERQKTPYELVTLKPGEELTIKNNIVLRLFEVEHTCPTAGYVVVEKRTKLKEEFREYPQDKLREMKERGVEIVRHLEVPQVAYLGDTQPGPHLIHDWVRTAKIVICECTFFEPDHAERAKIGQHMHVNDIAEWVRVLECEALVLTHVSRRTNLQAAFEQLEKLIGAKGEKVFFLMDHRRNRARYEIQAGEAERRERELQARGG